jgi:hypothetical protein
MGWENRRTWSLESKKNRRSREEFQTEGEAAPEGGVQHQREGCSSRIQK